MINIQPSKTIFESKFTAKQKSLPQIFTAQNHPQKKQLLRTAHFINITFNFISSLQELYFHYPVFQ